MSKPKHTPVTQPTRRHINVFGQMLKLIPRDIIHRTAKETGVDVKARTYSVLSHLGTMLFVQLAHALSLNDVCDWLRLKTRAIAAFGLTPPSCNNLSNSNKVRDAKFAELVFWRTLAHLQHCDRSFGRQRPGGNAGRSLLHRFKVRIHAVDSTVMELVANCMNWAKHRRRKAAAKMRSGVIVRSNEPDAPAAALLNKRAKLRLPELGGELKIGKNAGIGNSANGQFGDWREDVRYKPWTLSCRRLRLHHGTGLTAGRASFMLRHRRRHRSMLCRRKCGRGCAARRMIFRRWTRCG